MNELQWQAFLKFRESFKEKCNEWAKLSDKLYPLQRDAALKDTPAYNQETAVVYNQALDELTQKDDIHLIVIGDNPGKEEQLACNRKYLVGQSGRIAEGFFRRNPELNTDFRKNVIILNKTPVHTAKTAHLRYLANNSQEIQNLILESQKWMAQATAKLHKALVLGTDLVTESDTTNSRLPSEKKPFIPQLWLVGYAELKGKNGLFLSYRDCLKSSYFENTKDQTSFYNNKLNQLSWNSVFVYQHFSMNRFLVDLKSFRGTNSSLTITQSLEELGHKHRDEIFTPYVA